MRISKKGLYALKAMMVLGKNYPQCLTKIHEIASGEGIPEKFLEEGALRGERARCPGRLPVEALAPANLPGRNRPHH
jgi:hypothetical protein